MLQKYLAVAGTPQLHVLLHIVLLLLLFLSFSATRTQGQVVAPVRFSGPLHRTRIRVMRDENYRTRDGYLQRPGGKLRKFDNMKNMERRIVEVLPPVKEMDEPPKSQSESQDPATPADMGKSSPTVAKGDKSPESQSDSQAPVTPQDLERNFASLEKVRGQIPEKKLTPSAGKRQDDATGNGLEAPSLEGIGDGAFPSPDVRQRPLPSQDQVSRFLNGLLEGKVPAIAKIRSQQSNSGGDKENAQLGPRDLSPIPPRPKFTDEDFKMEKDDATGNGLGLGDLSPIQPRPKFTDIDYKLQRKRVYPRDPPDLKSYEIDETQAATASISPAEMAQALSSVGQDMTPVPSREPRVTDNWNTVSDNTGPQPVYEISEM